MFELEVPTPQRLSSLHPQAHCLVRNNNFLFLGCLFGRFQCSSELNFKKFAHGAPVLRCSEAQLLAPYKRRVIKMSREPSPTLPQLSSFFSFTKDFSFTVITFLPLCNNNSILIFLHKLNTTRVIKSCAASLRKARAFALRLSSRGFCSLERLAPFKTQPPSLLAQI